MDAFLTPCQRNYYKTLKLLANRKPEKSITRPRVRTEHSRTLQTVVIHWSELNQFSKYNFMDVMHVGSFCFRIDDYFDMVSGVMNNGQCECLNNLIVPSHSASGNRLQ